MDAVLDMFRVLWEPQAVFGRIKERPRFVVAWLVLSALLLVLSLLSRPYQNAAMEAFRATLPAEQAARMGSPGQSIVKVVIGTPIVCFIALAAGAGLLWIGVAITGTQARYKTLLSILAHGAITYAIFGAISWIVLNVRGVESVSSFADLRPPLGLDLLAPGAGLFVGAVLNGINPFSVWGVWLCGTGISVTHGTARGSAITMTALAYVVGLVLLSSPILLLGMLTKR
ncbi:MAG: hypothetical protein DMD37_04060 [Gemmatimonadetes bacterium]|nr:MAG: hypothetical protein DMD74_07455 [Gemmatimonadota bacterium]PYO85902.1 MAG: hypothetical protein DMD68_02025 [Gemmatimonadota bacterium]PYP64067.1 MAG: hypothetical protein DMD37_04060 [Gemmatimonadota bacterium]